MRPLNLLAAAALIVPLSLNAAFPDVSTNHPHAEAINYVKAQGIVAGNPDGTFKPDLNISRAAFTKIVVETYFSAGDINACGDGVTSFSDVDTAAWFAPYVCVAANKNLISGYPDGTFKPGENINVVEAAKIISAHRKGTQTGSPWFKPYLDDLSEAGAIPTQINAVDQKVTRGLMAEMIHRLDAKITSKSSKMFDGSKFVAKTGDVMVKKEAMVKINIPTGDFSHAGTLEDVTDGNASGNAKARFANGKYEMVALFNNLPALQDDYFYEGWVVKGRSVISTGEAVQKDGVWVNVYTNNKDLTDHEFYVLTLEPRDGDPAPAGHVLEGNITKKALATAEADVMVKDETVMMKKEPAMNEVFSAARYEALKASGDKFILNFSADWCPNCQKLKQTINSNLSGLPAGTVVLETDYDTYTDLKKEFGVTRQTTGVFFEGGAAVKTQSGLSFNDIKTFFEQ